MYRFIGLFFSFPACLHYLTCDLDTVSHEMRNPLSAITQLADGIARSLEPQNNQHGADYYRNVAEDNVSSANIILACAAHQKRVGLHFIPRKAQQRRNIRSDVLPPALSDY